MCLLSLTLHIHSGTQPNISAVSESSQHTKGRQDKPPGDAEFGDSVSGLGTGPGSGSHLLVPKVPAVCSGLWGCSTPGAVVRGGACETVGDLEAADNDINC